MKNRAEVTAYIPQLRLPGFSHPFLACDISQIDECVIGWKSDYLYDSLFHEASQILDQTKVDALFSQIKKFETWKN